MLKKGAFSFLLLFCQISFCEKVLIITHAYNRPEFIEIQHRTFEKFLADDYEFVVFNDARPAHMVEQINQVCEKNNVRCIRIPQEIHTRPYLPRRPGDPIHRPNIRHANNTQYSCDILGFDHDGIVFIIDSDMFLVRPFNISEYMEDKEVSSLLKSSNETVWHVCPAICFLHMNRLPDKRTMNFNCGVVDNNISVDSGGWTYYYFKKHPELRVAAVDSEWSYKMYLGNTDINRPVDHTTPDEVKIKKYQELGFNEKEIRFFLKKPDTFEYFLDKKFFHYHGGSNHHNMPQHYHDRKTQIFKEYVEDILSDE